MSTAISKMTSQELVSELRQLAPAGLNAWAVVDAQTAPRPEQTLGQALRATRMGSVDPEVVEGLLLQEAVKTPGFADRGVQADYSIRSLTIANSLAAANEVFTQAPTRNEYVFNAAAGEYFEEEGAVGGYVDDQTLAHHDQLMVMKDEGELVAHSVMSIDQAGRVPLEAGAEALAQAQSRVDGVEARLYRNFEERIDAARAAWPGEFSKDDLVLAEAHRQADYLGSYLRDAKGRAPELPAKGQRPRPNLAQEPSALSASNDGPSL